MVIDARVGCRQGLGEPANNHANALAWSVHRRVPIVLRTPTALFGLAAPDTQVA